MTTFTKSLLRGADEWALQRAYLQRVLRCRIQCREVTHLISLGGLTNPLSKGVREVGCQNPPELGRQLSPHQIVTWQTNSQWSGDPSLTPFLGSVFFPKCTITQSPSKSRGLNDGVFPDQPLAAQNISQQVRKDSPTTPVSTVLTYGLKKKVRIGVGIVA